MSPVKKTQKIGQGLAGPGRPKGALNKTTAASLSIEMAERLIAEAAKAGLSLDDLEPELNDPETIIREALESSEGAPGD